MSQLVRAFVVLLVITLGLRAQSPELSPEVRGALDMVSEAAMKKHIQVIAADELQGRDTGSIGHNKACDYIRARWKEAGLISLVEDGSFYQPWVMRTPAPDYEKSQITWRRGAKKGTLKGGGNKRDEQSFQIFPFSGSGSVNAPIVFVGYGISASEYKYDDYAQVDVKGKIVLCFRHEPRELDDSGWNGKTNTKHASFEEKYVVAVKNGAAAFLCITDPLNHKSDQRRPLEQRYSQLPVPPREKGAKSAEIPAVWLDFDAAAAMVGGEKILSDLQKKIDDTLAPASSLISGLSATVNVRLAAQDVPTQNVCGYLPGADPTLAEEFIVLGAHADHVGVATNGKDKIFNGADDNGSGTTTLITIAQAMGKAGVKPRRSVIFLAFSGEEKGLLGSEYYVAHPLRPIEKTVAMINMDMVGRNFKNGCEIIGTQFSPALRRIIDTEADALKMKIEFKPGTDSQRILERSDQAPFFKRNVPVAFFTTGLHNDYHQVSDHWELLHCDNMAQIGKLIIRTAMRLADADARPEFVPVD